MRALSVDVPISSIGLRESAVKYSHRLENKLNVLFAGSDKAPRTAWGKWQNTSQSGEEVRRFSEDGWIGEISYE